MDGLYCLLFLCICLAIWVELLLGWQGSRLSTNILVASWVACRNILSEIKVRDENNLVNKNKRIKRINGSRNSGPSSGFDSFYFSFAIVNILWLENLLCKNILEATRIIMRVFMLRCCELDIILERLCSYCTFICQVYHCRFIATVWFHSYNFQVEYK